MAECKKCGKQLQADEISLHRKIIDPNDAQYLCLECMADFFKCDTEILKKKIIHFRNIGCILFGGRDE